MLIKVAFAKKARARKNTVSVSMPDWSVRFFANVLTVAIHSIVKRRLKIKVSKWISNKDLN